MILRFLIPVRSRSSSSRRASHCFPSLLASRSMSTVSSKPSLIMPPSRMVTGGSSSIAAWISWKISCRQSISASMLLSSWEDCPARTALIAGSISKELRKAIKSLGFAVLYVTLLSNRSRSYTGFRYSLISSLDTLSAQNSSRASKRRSISSLSIKGCSSMLRRSLPPIAVLVRSSTHSREPRFCFSRRVSVSSRFLLVELSSSIYLLVR